MMLAHREQDLAVAWYRTHWTWAPQWAVVDTCAGEWRNQLRSRTAHPSSAGTCQEHRCASEFKSLAEVRLENWDQNAWGLSRGPGTPLPNGKAQRSSNLWEASNQEDMQPALGVSGLFDFSCGWHQLDSILADLCGISRVEATNTERLEKIKVKNQQEITDKNIKTFKITLKKKPTTMRYVIILPQSF